MLKLYDVIVYAFTDLREKFGMYGIEEGFKLWVPLCKPCQEEIHKHNKGPISTEMLETFEFMGFKVIVCEHKDCFFER